MSEKVSNCWLTVWYLDERCRFYAYARLPSTADRRRTWREIRAGMSCDPWWPHRDSSPWAQTQALNVQSAHHYTSKQTHIWKRVSSTEYGGNQLTSQLRRRHYIYFNFWSQRLIFMWDKFRSESLAEGPELCHWSVSFTEKVWPIGAIERCSEIWNQGVNVTSRWSYWLTKELR